MTGRCFDFMVNYKKLPYTIDDSLADRFLLCVEDEVKKARLPLQIHGGILSEDRVMLFVRHVGEEFDTMAILSKLRYVVGGELQTIFGIPPKKTRFGAILYNDTREGYIEFTTSNCLWETKKKTVGVERYIDA